MTEQDDKFKRIAKNESPEVVAALLASMAKHIENQKQLITKLEAERQVSDQLRVPDHAGHQFRRHDGHPFWSHGGRVFRWDGGHPLAGVGISGRHANGISN